MNSITAVFVDDLGERDPQSGVNEEYSIKHVPRVGEYVKFDTDWRRYRVLEVTYNFGRQRSVTIKVAYEPQPLL